MRRVTCERRAFYQQACVRQSNNMKRVGPRLMTICGRHISFEERSVVRAVCLGGAHPVWLAI